MVKRMDAASFIITHHRSLSVARAAGGLRIPCGAIVVYHNRRLLSILSENIFRTKNLKICSSYLTRNGCLCYTIDVKQERAFRIYAVLQVCVLSVR